MEAARGAHAGSRCTARGRRLHRQVLEPSSVSRPLRSRVSVFLGPPRSRVSVYHGPPRSRVCRHVAACGVDSLAEPLSCLRAGFAQKA